MKRYMIMQMADVVEYVYSEDIAKYMDKHYGPTWRWRYEIFLITKVEL